MSDKTLINEIVNWRLVVGGRKLTSEKYHAEIQRFRKKAKELKLVREQYAVNTVLDAMLNDIATYELTLVYVYNGVKYCTTKKKVPGCKSTNVLHDMGSLKSADWDAMKKYHVWVETGEVLAPVL